MICGQQLCLVPVVILASDSFQRNLQDYPPVDKVNSIIKALDPVDNETRLTHFPPQQLRTPETHSVYCRGFVSQKHTCRANLV